MEPPLLFNRKIPLKRRLIDSVAFAIMWLMMIGLALLLLWVVIAATSDAWHVSVNSDAEHTVRQMVRPECLRRAR